METGITISSISNNGEAEKIDKEAERVALMIEDAQTEEELDAVYDHVGDGQMDLFLQKKEQIAKSKTAK